MTSKGYSPLYSSKFSRCLSLILLLVWAQVMCYGQMDTNSEHNPDPDRIIRPNTSLNEPRQHSVRRAVLYSAALPGLGQAYNRKYWKIPIVYAALAGTTYFIIDNHRQYKFYYDGLEKLVLEGEDIFGGQFTPQNLIFISNTYRRWRDLSAILFVVAYSLNILDAYVDAHFFYFDISDDLSLRISPAIQQVNTALVPGAAFTFIFDSRMNRKFIK
ncbi:MAG: DUF5683 domain-containing protein [Thermaurantimonas sp.]